MKERARKEGKPESFYIQQVDPHLHSYGLYIIMVSTSKSVVHIFEGPRVDVCVDAHTHVCRHGRTHVCRHV